MLVYIIGNPAHFLEAWLELATQTVEPVMEIRSIALISISDTYLNAEERKAWPSQKKILTPGRKLKPGRKTFSSKTIPRRHWTGAKKDKAK